MPTLYIAGPMRGLPDSNFDSFDRAAAILRSHGWTILSPAEMDRRHGDSGKVGEQVGVNGGEPAWVRKFVRRDVEVLVNALRAEDGDGLAILPGCDKSTGCRAEVALARWLKLKLYSAVSGTEIGGLPDPLDAVNRDLAKWGWWQKATAPPEPEFRASCRDGVCYLD